MEDVHNKRAALGPRGVSTVSETIRGIVSGANGRSPGGALRLHPAPSLGHRSDLGVGAKRSPHGGGFEPSRN